MCTFPNCLVILVLLALVNSINGFMMINIGRVVLVNENDPLHALLLSFYNIIIASSEIVISSTLLVEDSLFSLAKMSTIEYYFFWGGFLFLLHQFSLYIYRNLMHINVIWIMDGKC